MRKLLAALADGAIPSVCRVGQACRVMSRKSMRETVLFSAFLLSVLVWVAFWVAVGRLAARSF
jgi:hypothetical protein